MQSARSSKQGARVRTWRIDDFYIAAVSPRVTADTLVLKHGETFGVFDEHGNIGAGRGEAQGYEGLYHDGTRFLSAEVLLLNGQPPLLLSSSVETDGTTIGVDLTNPDISLDGRVVLPHGSIHISRKKVLWEGVYYESISVVNYGRIRHELVLGISFAADFADIFEVRGMKRAKRGVTEEPRFSKSGMEFAYKGLDGVRRRALIGWNYEPESVDDEGPLFFMELRPKEERVLELSVACEISVGPKVTSFERARRSLKEEMNRLSSDEATIETSNEEFDSWLQRSAADLHALTSRLETGPYPYAGIPWFSAPFGRDGAVTALEYLMVNPEFSKGVLSYLAATQADVQDEFSQSEPGKTIHEMRGGEMCAIGEVPFRRYYGSVDSTLLFVWLAAEYLRHTDDVSFVEGMWPAIEKAVSWADEWGDRDGDGFVEYEGHYGNGLENQGWKDSSDAVFHADGRIPKGPIALAEVQAYLHRCRLGAASIAWRLGMNDFASEQERKARALEEAFDAAFWCEEIGMYALALDGRKRQCAVRTSNGGQVLVAKISPEHRAAATVKALMGADFYSGWGIRTVARGEPLYNPVAYHNGSVWPHDNALIAYGMSLYGFKQEVLRIVSGLFDAVRHFAHMRMPELFCGFDREEGKGPVLYPVACSPQAWAAGAVFLLLRSCLGLSVHAQSGRLVLDRPALPDFLPQVKITGLRCGDSAVTLLFSRHEEDVGVNVLQRDGPLDVVIIK